MNGKTFVDSVVEIVSSEFPFQEGPFLRDFPISERIRKDVERIYGSLTSFFPSERIPDILAGVVARSYVSGIKMQEKYLKEVSKLSLREG